LNKLIRSKLLYIIVIFLLVFLMPVHINASSWLAGYSYRKAITISSASGAVTNYQMMLLLGESSGATGETVDCGGLCQTDFDDIRFTTSDGTTLLDYWIESISGTTPNQLATTWIEFNSIGTGATLFYMYYGNGAAVSYSNISNTMLFGDDFNRDDSGTVGNGWGEVETTSIISNNIVANHNGAGIAQIYKSFDFGSSGQYMYEVSIKPSQTNKVVTSVIYGNPANTSNAGGWKFESNGSMYYLTSGGTWVLVSTYTASYYTLGTLFNRDTGKISYYKARSLIGPNKTGMSDGTSNRIDTVVANDSGGVISADWCFIRQFVTTEPMWRTWGGQETYTDVTDVSKVDCIAISGFSKIFGVSWVGLLTIK